MAVLLSFLVTAAFFSVAVVIGFRLARSAKPYPFTLLASHVVLFFLIALGIGACMNAADAGTNGTPMSLATVSLCFAGPALIVLFVTGVWMIWSKQKKRGWILAHKLAMYFLGLSIGVAGILAVLKR